MSTYEKKTWVNNETKVNATNMNHIEEGIYENANDIEQIQHDMESYENEISEVQEDVEQCEEDILELRNKIEIFKELTYAELKTLKNNNELAPNKAYRITDYVTKVNGKINNISDLARSMEHPFDIFVLATSTNTFSEEAFACLHEGDTYFAEEDLESWKLWYCFENDTNRFEWADTENGKGVIYRMIDEFDNDIPYDFKNIQFKRYKITGTTDSRQEGLIGSYFATEGSKFVSVDKTDYQWFYTFTRRSNGEDLSVHTTTGPTYQEDFYVKQVVIEEYLADSPAYRCKRALNNNVIIVDNFIVDVRMKKGNNNNTFVGNMDIDYDYFGEMCRRNIIVGELMHAKTDECFEDNTIGNGTVSLNSFRWTRTANHFSRNIIIHSTQNTFLNQVSDSKFPDYMSTTDFKSFVSHADMSGIHSMASCEIGYCSHCTYIAPYVEPNNQEYSWRDVKFVKHAYVTINTYLLQKSDLSSLHFVSITAQNKPVIGLNIKPLYGTSSSNILNIDLTDAPYINSRYMKTLGYSKSENGTSIEYTYETIINDITQKGGIYSEDNGATWLPLAQDQELSNTLEITSEDITVEGDKTVFSSDVAQKIMSMNKRLRVDASIVDPRLEQGKFIAVFTPRAIIDYSLPEGTIVYEYSTTNWLLDTYRTTYAEFLWDATAEKLYVNANSPAKYEDHIVGFSTENTGSIGLTSNIDMRTSSINILRINDLDIVSITDMPSLEFNANSNNELESVAFKQNGFDADFTYTIPKGAKHYVVNELPTTDIDTTGNYYVMTESENARGYLSTDINNLSQSEYPSSNPSVLRQNAVVNSNDFTQLQMTYINAGSGYMGDFAIKFNIPCNVSITLNPRQSNMAFMYIDVNGVNVKLVGAGSIETYTRTFNVGETLCVRGANFNTSSNMYYKLAIQPHTIDGKIPLSTNVDEYINFENLWFKNGGGGKLYRHSIKIANINRNGWCYLTIDASTNTPFTTSTIFSYLINIYGANNNRFNVALSNDDTIPMSAWVTTESVSTLGYDILSGQKYTYSFFYVVSDTVTEA